MADRVETSDAHRNRARDARSIILAVGAAVAMTIAGLGVASAQTSSEGGPSPAESAPEAQEEHPRKHGRHCHPGVRARLVTAAEAIGIAERELLEGLRAGQSIAAVAEANGVEADAVVAALADQAREHIADKVEAGELTQEQADERIAMLEDRIVEFVNREGFAHQGRHRRFRPGPADA